MSEHLPILIAANFTAEPLVESLEFWNRQLGWERQFQFAPYDQVVQTILSGRGADIVLLRTDRVSAEFMDAFLDAARERPPSIVVLCPGTEVFKIDSVHVLSAGEILGRYPVAEVFDPNAEKLGDVPYTPEFFAAMGTTIIRTLHALRARPYKAIALDCDNTLWQGACGEDGPENVTLDAPRRRLQEFMLAQRDAGMLLATASKNNESDVRETFRLHPEMPLRMDDFVVHRIDWNSKGASLPSIAAQLDLGLDSFIFVDDSPKEIAEVEAACPEVLCLDLPHDDAEIPHFLDHVWAFDHPRVTEEDRQRNEAYRQQARRGEIRQQAATLEEFIEQLHVEVHIQPLEPARVARVAQLTQRTNQMNTTLIRRTESEVAATECFTADVSDRFGSYGLVGAMFIRDEPETLCVDALLLSCRALGRGAEHRMVAQAGKIALARGKAFVEVAFVEGPRNRPALDFLNSLPGAGTGAGFRLAAKVCAELKFLPVASAPVEIKATRAAASTPLDYGRIARELSTVAQVLHAIREEKRRDAAHRTPAAPPRTPLEQQIARIWAEVLHVPAPGRGDDFFDLGGHSLLAVQLLSRVNREFTVELSLDLVYSGDLTVASMAAAVEIAQTDPEEIDRLLAEIDDLPEDELRALLDSE